MLAAEHPSSEMMTLQSPPSHLAEIWEESSETSSVGHDGEKDRQFAKEALPHERALFAGALRLTRCAAEAEDLLQETFMKAYRAFDQFEPGTNCRAWLFRIQKNTFINRYRRKKREFEIVYGVEKTAVEHTFMNLSTRMAASNPEYRVTDQQFGDEVLKALEKVPEHFRSVVLMSDIDELSYKEVAEKLSIPVGTVMSRLFRGRRILRQELNQYATSIGIAKDTGEALAA